VVFNRVGGFKKKMGHAALSKKAKNRRCKGKKVGVKFCKKRVQRGPMVVEKRAVGVLGDHCAVLPVGGR